MLLWLLRAVYVFLLIGSSLAALNVMHYQMGQPMGAALGAMAAILGIGGLIFWTDIREREKQITTLSSIYFGLTLGFLLGYLFWLAVEPIVSDSFPGSEGRASNMAQLIRFVISLVCIYITVSTLVQTKDEFRFIIPYVEFAKQIRGARPLVLDTSVIIDGRVADLCETRIVDSKIVVPRFVLNELQGIADSSDKLRRNRGRRGLDVLKRLQTNPKVDLEMHDGNLGESRDAGTMKVDERLVAFAKAMGGRIVTNDFNLNKMAQLQGVDVINLNEVANSLKTVALPGELMTVKIVRPGDQAGQGVGYLEDGTMIVIEQGRAAIGQEVQITVTSVLQNPAGRMIFGRVGVPGSSGSGSHTPLGGSGPHAPLSDSSGSGSART